MPGASCGASSWRASRPELQIRGSSGNKESRILTNSSFGGGTTLRPTLYNTEARTEQKLDVVHAGEVRLYTCGPTVYNHAHIGNLRTFLFEDLLRRSLRFFGYRVNQVMNLTDVDDKIIQRAAETGQTCQEYAEPYIESFFTDLDRLHIERVEHYPRATDHIPEMVAMIEQLVDRGYAYVSDGSVFFSISKDEDYGRLSRFDLEEVRQGERVADDDYGKEDARDFVLWKEAKPGEPFWDSPWGKGRPGWHIECSAMSMKYLGDTFDIHCGGVDNIFPHHENEIAQSESATGKTFVHHWVHAAHLIVDGEKMSKSLGNQYTLDQLLEKGVDLRAVRYLFLSVHYRKKLNFTFGALDDARAALGRIDEMRFRLRNAAESAVEDSSVAGAGATLRGRFAAALAEDLNFSKALAALFDFIKTVNVAIEENRLGAGDKERVDAVLAEIDNVLGVLDPEEWRETDAVETELSDAEIGKLVEERGEARESGDYARSDEIRDRLAAEGILLEDTPQGTRWKKK